MAVLSSSVLGLLGLLQLWIFSALLSVSCALQMLVQVVAMLVEHYAYKGKLAVGKPQRQLVIHAETGAVIFPQLFFCCSLLLMCIM